MRVPLRTGVVVAMLALRAAVLPAQEPSPSPPRQQEAPPPAPAGPWDTAVRGEIVNYAIAASHPFFGAERRVWWETSTTLAADVRYRSVSLLATALALKTTGRDPFGSGSGPAGAPGVAGPGRPPQLRLDRLALQFSRIGGLPLTATIGRQPIAIGTQFLIGDAVYDGFSAAARQAVFHNPRKGFDAVRLEWEVKGTRFDLFGYRIDRTWDAAGGADGRLAGLDVSRGVGKAGTSYGGGLFYRSSPSNADNDMAIVTARGEQHFDGPLGPFAGGEIVLETAGRCRSVVYCTRAGQPMNEVAWHAEAGFSAEGHPLKPFAEAGYVSYSKDFTPVATGSSDWGKWYLGNQIDWIVFSTNSRIVRAQAGWWPRGTLKLRGQYHNTRLAKGGGPGGTLSNEFSAIAEWYPAGRFWANVLVGSAHPGRALPHAGLGNAFGALYADAVPVGHHSSVDFVLAAGIKF